MTPRELEEYRALRDTIRERGTVRVWVFVAGISAWAGLTVATSALAQVPVAALLPLFVLTAVFEAVFSLHVGVERIGRYIQVFLEPDGGWEHQAMAFGRPGRGLRTDALFSGYFAAAVLLNFIPVLLLDPVRIELAVVGGAHILVLVRIVAARAVAGRQRAIELERFSALKRERSASPR
jgi:hypothetical protein